MKAGMSLTGRIRRMKWGQTVDVPPGMEKTARNAVAGLNGRERGRSVWTCGRNGGTLTVTKSAKNPETQRMYRRRAETGELRRGGREDALLARLLAMEDGDTLTLKETPGRATWGAVRRLKAKCRPELRWVTEWSEGRPLELAVRCVRKADAAAGSLNEAAIALKCGRLTLSKREAAAIVGGEERLNALHERRLIRIAKSGKGGNSRWACNMGDVIRYATESGG